MPLYEKDLFREGINREKSRQKHYNVSINAIVIILLKIKGYYKSGPRNLQLHPAPGTLDKFLSFSCSCAEVIL